MALAGCASLPAARAAQTLRYNFDSIADPSVDAALNLAPGATQDGILLNPDKISVVDSEEVLVGSLRYALGKSLQLNNVDSEESTAGCVDTGLNPTGWSMANGNAWNRDYTAMAWVKFNSIAGDNMVFGQFNGDALHLGSRNGFLHSGHWGDDIGPDQGVSVATGTGSWQHVAWVNQGNAQSIYRNGVLVVGPGAGGASGGSGDNLIIGSFRNNGSLVGSIDEIKVFGDQVLTAAQIQAEMTNTLSLITLAGLESASLTNAGWVITLRDFLPNSVVNPATVTLNIDGSAVTPTSVTKSGAVTTITYNPLPPFYDSATNHTFAVRAKDQSAPAVPNITANGTLRSPVFPPTLAGPAGAVGSWGLREWHKGSSLVPSAAGTTVLGAVVAQVATLNPGDPGVTDATGVPVLNHSDPENPGGKGNFNNDFPFIANIPGADDNDVAVVGKTRIVVPAAGLYTFAAHSDDGIGIRINGGPSGNTGKFVSVTGGGVQIDSGDPQTATFSDYTGDSNLHAVYSFSAPGTYDVLVVAFEGGGGAFWELAWAPGSFGADRDTNTWSLVGSPADPSLPAFTPKFATQLPGPPGTAGNFGMRVYRNATGVDNLGKTSDFVRTTTRQPNDGNDDVVDVLSPYLNFGDPGNGNGGVLPSDEPFPGDQPGGQDNVVTVAKGRINIPTTGTYTFWAQGDDGFLLRIKGVNGAPNPKWSRATQGGNEGAGRFEMSNPNELFYENGTGNTNTRGIITLDAGEYDLEYLQWEGGGGYWYELAAAPGSWPDNTTPLNGWQAVGYDFTGSGLITNPGMAAPGWTVESSTPGRPEFSFNIAGGEAAIDATLADDTAPAAKTSTWDFIDFNDPQSGNDGSYTPNNVWPLNTSGDDNNYAMRATGTLNITVAGEYLLGFQGDDGGYLFINGPGNPVFSSIFSTNHPAQATIGEEVSGSGINNAIRVEVGTGNSRTLVRTTLAVGSYTLKTMMYEGGGGSWWEVIGSGAGSPFLTQPLLAKGPGSTFTDRKGLLLTAQPQAELAITGYTADQNTGDFSLTFGSILGNNYSVEYTTGLSQSAGGPASPLKWNTAPAPLDSFPGNGQSTTVSGNVTTLLAPGGQLPDLSKAFFRVRRL